MLDAFTSASIPGVIVPVVLSGGFGTRLRPQARKAYSKQFWPTLSERTLLQKEVGRGGDERFSDPIILANTDHRFIVAGRGDTLNVTRIVDWLRRAGRSEAEARNCAYRPWGFCESLVVGSRVQVGSYLGEDDIVRLEETYGRN